MNRLENRSASLKTLTAAAAGTYTSDDQLNVSGRSVQVIFDATVATTTSAVLTIQGKDPVSGKYFTLLAGAAVTTVSTNVYTVGPGATVTANVGANASLPLVWRVSIVVTGGASALTATVGANVNL